MPRVIYAPEPDRKPQPLPLPIQQRLWSEQLEYELYIRPTLAEGIPPHQTARQTGLSVRTIQRKLREFRQLGMFALVPQPLEELERRWAGLPKPKTKDSQVASATKRRGLPVSPEEKAYLFELRAEYPAFRPGELVEICFVKFGHRLSHHTVARLLAQNADLLAVTPERRFAPYASLPEGTERRRAVVTLFAEGWNVKSLAAYLQVSRVTVYDILDRFLVEGVMGLADKSHATHHPSRKIDLPILELVRKLCKENPALGEFRVHAALLEEFGIDLSPRSCGRILARLREMEPQIMEKARNDQLKTFPYYADRPHQYWTVDLRYIETHLLGGGPFYVITILDNYSRLIVGSGIFRSQDLASYLIVLYAAIRDYGAPENLISDRGGIFLANQAKLIYQRLGINKIEYEHHQPWQSLIETNFNLQRRLVDAGWAKVTNWAEAEQAHQRWLHKHNHQSHWGHRKRADKKRNPKAVLGESKGRLFDLAELERLFNSVTVKRKIDRVGYLKFRHWRFYAEINLAALPGYKHQARLWLHKQDLRVEYGGQSLAQYEVSYEADQKNFKEFKLIQLYDNQLPALQPMLFPAEWVEWQRFFDCRRPKNPSSAPIQPFLAEQLVLPTFKRA